MKPCYHADHADAHVDPATGWILTGDEAYTPDEWDTHGGFVRRGVPSRYANPEEKRQARNARERERMRRKREAA